jgi:hypothetical protein
MCQYAMLKGFDQCEKFLLEHPHLCDYVTYHWLGAEAFKLAKEGRVSLVLRNLLIEVILG